MLLRLNKSMSKGTTLVESLWAILIMTIVALAGAAFIFFSTVRVNLERTKRIALEMASTRLEELRASGYTSIEPPDSNLYYISEQAGAWVLALGDPGETVNIGDQIYPITTTVQYWDDPDNPGSDDYLLVAVSVAYRLNPVMQVTLTTYIQSLG